MNKSTQQVVPASRLILVVCLPQFVCVSDLSAEIYDLFRHVDRHVTSTNHVRSRCPSRPDFPIKNAYYRSDRISKCAFVAFKSRQLIHCLLNAKANITR